MEHENTMMKEISEEILQDEIALGVTNATFALEHGIEKARERRAHVRLYKGNAIRYGCSELESSLFILLGNVYTKQWTNPTHRVLGKLEENGSGEFGIVYQIVPTTEDGGESFMKRTDEDLPVLLAVLARDRRFRSALEKDLKTVFPKQFWNKAEKHDDDDDTKSLISSRSTACTRSTAGDTEYSTRDVYKSDELRELAEHSPEFATIYEVGRAMLLSNDTGDDDDDEVEIVGAKCDEAGGFISLKTNITEKGLVKKWIKVVKRRLDRKLHGVSENRALVSKFKKAKQHIRYKFTEMNDADFDKVLQTAFPYVDVMKEMAGLIEALVTCDNSTENQEHSSKKMSAMEKQKRARAEYEAKEGLERKRRRTSKKKA